MKTHPKNYKDAQHCWLMDVIMKVKLSMKNVNHSVGNIEMVFLQLRK